MEEINLKTKLDDSQLTQLEGMAHYWDEIARRYDLSGNSFADIYQKQKRTEILDNELRQIGQMLGENVLWIISDYLQLRDFCEIKEKCPCRACKDVKHLSDCAVHDAPALPIGECNCK